QTGVGAPVCDMFDKEGLRTIRVVITGGHEEAQEGRKFMVPKSEIVSMIDAKLHSGELQFAAELSEAPAMQAELQDFRRHVSEAGRYSFSAREGKHDDLILACGIALWRAIRKKPNFRQGGGRHPTVNRGYESQKRHYRRPGY